jgi:hypothetical protein
MFVSQVLYLSSVFLAARTGTTHIKFRIEIQHKHTYKFHKETCFVF